MSSIKGRADDMLIIRGVNLFHTQVEVLLEDFPELAPCYQLIVTRKKTMDEVKLEVEVAPAISQKLGGRGFGKKDLIVKITNQLSRKIKNNIGLSMRVELKEFGKIPRSVGGKLSRIKDLRKLK